MRTPLSKLGEGAGVRKGGGGLDGGEGTRASRGSYTLLKEV